MRLFYVPCQLVQEQKGVLEPPEPPPGYATVQIKMQIKSADRFAESAQLADQTADRFHFANRFAEHITVHINFYF